MNTLEKAKRLLAEGDKLGAIKLFRDEKNLDLKTAKDEIEKLENQIDPETPPGSSAPSKSIEELKELFVGYGCSGFHMTRDGYWDEHDSIPNAKKKEWTYEYQTGLLDRLTLDPCDYSITHQFFHTRLAITFTALATLIVLVHMIENPRGKREWERTVAEVEAQGISLDWEDYRPAPIADEGNLAVAPVIAYWHRTGNSYTGPRDIQWQATWGDLEQLPKLSKTLRSAAKDFENSEQWLKKAMPPQSDAWLELANALQPYQALLSEIRLQCRTRPESWIPGDYSKAFASPIPNFKQIRDYGALLFAQSQLAIHQGDAERALENTEAIQRISNMNPGAYFLVNSMIETVVYRNYLLPIYREGIRTKIFTESQLLELAKHCNEQNRLLQLEHSMHYETATCAHDIEQRILESDLIGLLNIFGRSDISELTNRLTPTGWQWIMISRLTNYQALHLSSIDGQQRRIDLELAQSNTELIDGILEDPEFFDLLAAMAVPAYNKVFEITLDAHIQTDMTAIACSLELYRRQSGTYPENLDALTDGSSIQIHNDPITGAPYHYERVNEGYRLWSVGMNQTDENGTRAENGDDASDIVYPLSSE